MDLPNFLSSLLLSEESSPNQVPGRDLNPRLNLQQEGVLTSKLRQ
jgi:hypothetical protein